MARALRCMVAVPQIVKAGRGQARLGWARQGKARQGKGHSVGVLRIVSAAGECYGEARLGKARQGTARQGKARQGCFGTWWRFRKSSRLGVARRGMAGQGLAWRGVLFSNINEGLNYDFSGRHDKAKAG
jgi:hypothetical protein